MIRWMCERVFIAFIFRHFFVIPPPIKNNSHGMSYGTKFGRTKNWKRQNSLLRESVFECSARSGIVHTNETNRKVNIYTSCPVPDIIVYNSNRWCVTNDLSGHCVVTCAHFHTPDATTTNWSSACSWAQNATICRLFFTFSSGIIFSFNMFHYHQAASTIAWNQIDFVCNNICFADQTA